MKTMTHKKLAIPVLMIAASLLMLFSSNAQSQTYKADFSTKLVLPSGGTDPTHLFTITAGTISTAMSWTLPTTAGASGNVLSTNGSGVLSWVDPAATVTLAGDVTGAANSNSIATTAANDIIAALNSGSASTAITTPVDLTAKTLTAASGGTITTTGAVDGGTGTFTGAASAVGLTSTGGLSTSGGAANLSTTDISGVNIGTGSFANPIDIGNGNGSTGTYSTTLIAGKVNFTGTVSLPSGSVSAGSIGLTTNDLMVGVGGYGSALPTAISGVLVTNGSGVPSISSTLPNGLTMNNATIGGTSSINTSGAITTTGTLGAGAATVTSLDAGSGAITTTGTLGAGAATVTSLNAGSGTIQTTGTITSGGDATLGTGASATSNSFGTGANAASVADVIGSTGAGSTTQINGAVTFQGPVTFPSGSVSAGSITHGAANTFLTTANDGTTVAFTGLSVSTGLSGDGIGTALTNTGVLSANNTDGTLTLTGTGAGPFTGAITASLNLSHANSWSGTQTFVNLTSTGLGTFNNLTATGTVTLPSGSVGLSSLSLANGDLIVGSGGVATAVAPTGDVAITTGGVTSVNSVQTGAGSSIATAINSNPGNAINGDNITHDATLQVNGSHQLGVNLANANTWNAEQTFSSGGTGLNVTTNATVGGTLGVTGATTLGSVALSATTTVAANPSQVDWALATTNSYFLISAAAATTVRGIVARPAGSMIVLVNTGSNPITLSNADGLEATPANQFHFQGATNVIMAQDGTVTLIYDATYNSGVGAWRLISAQ